MLKSAEAENRSEVAFIEFSPIITEVEDAAREDAYNHTVTGNRSTWAKKEVVQVWLQARELIRDRGLQVPTLRQYLEATLQTYTNNHK